MSVIRHLREMNLESQAAEAKQKEQDTQKQIGPLFFDLLQPMEDQQSKFETDWKKFGAFLDNYLKPPENKAINNITRKKIEIRIPTPKKEESEDVELHGIGRDLTV